MKKIYLALLLMFVSGSLWAQQRHVFVLNEEYSTLTVEEGWPAVLIQSGTPNDKIEIAWGEGTDTLDRIVVYTDEQVKPQQVYRLNDGRLTIKPNRHNPGCTRLEIYTAQRVTRIEVREKAELTTSRFEGYGDLTVAQWENSCFRADTMSSPNLLFGFKDGSCVFHCKVFESRQVLFDSPNGKPQGTERMSRTGVPTEEEYVSLPYTGSGDRFTELWNEAPNVKFNEGFSLHVGLGYRVMINDADNEVNNESSPFYYTRKFNPSVSLYGKWRLNSRWTVKTGLQYDYFNMRLNIVDVSAWGMLITDGEGNTPDFQYSYVDQHFLGVPVDVTFHPFKRKPDALGLTAGLTASHQVVEGMYNVVLNEGRGNIAGVSTDGMLNPWRLELHFGVETNTIGVIHGLQYYVNLLPTYIGIPNAGKFRECGVSIFF